MSFLPGGEYFLFLGGEGGIGWRRTCFFFWGEFFNWNTLGFWKGVFFGFEFMEEHLVVFERGSVFFLADKTKGGFWQNGSFFFFLLRKLGMVKWLHNLEWAKRKNLVTSDIMETSWKHPLFH